MVHEHFVPRTLLLLSSFAASPLTAGLIAWDDGGAAGRRDGVALEDNIRPDIGCERVKGNDPLSSPETRRQSVGQRNV